MTETAEILRPPLIEGEKSLGDVTRDICEPLERGPTRLWWIAITISSTALLAGVIAVTYQIADGHRDLGA